MNQTERTATADQIRIAGISGSLRPGSYTRLAVEIALRGAQEVGAATQLIDLSDYELAFCTGRRDEPTYPEDVYRLRREVRAAHGVILGTPEYHGSLSGVLKNALDLMGFEELEGKMIGLIGVSAGTMGASDALNSLRAIGRALHAWVIPQQASVSEVRKVIDATGAVTSADLENRLMEVGRQVARFAYLHTSEQVREFLRLWEEAPMNPGGGP